MFKVYKLRPDRRYFGVAKDHIVAMTMVDDAFEDERTEMVEVWDNTTDRPFFSVTRGRGKDNRKLKLRESGIHPKDYESGTRTMFFQVRHLDRPIAVIEATSFMAATDKLLLLVNPKDRGSCTFVPVEDGGMVAIGEEPGPYNEKRLFVQRYETEHQHEWVSFTIFEAFVPPVEK
jgi:hypothetical protein